MLQRECLRSVPLVAALVALAAGCGGTERTTSSLAEPAAAPSGPSSIRGEWERDVRAGIARGAPAPQPLTPADEEQLRDELRRAVAGSGARVVELDVARPEGAVVTFVLATREPSRYLRSGLSPVLRVVYPYFGRLEGVYAALVEADGDMIWEYAVGRRLGRTRSQTVEELRGCNPIPDVPPPPQVRPDCPGG